MVETASRPLPKNLQGPTETAAQPHHQTEATSNDDKTAAANQQDSSNDNDREEPDEWLISCRCESAKAFSTLLSCLRHAALGASSAELAGLSSTQTGSNNRRNNSSKSSTNTIQPVTVFCSPSNLSFHALGAGASKQLQASVDMPSGLFSQYKVAQPDGMAAGEIAQDWQAGGEFCVNLHTLLECLHVLGTQNSSLEKTKLCFSYNMTQELFKLELLQPDSGILMTAAIPGMVTPESEAAGDSLAHAFRSSPNAARMILKSDILRDVVHELESVSGATNATVVLGKNKAGLELATCGSWGEVLVSIPAKGSHVVSWEPPKTMHPPIRTYSLKALLASLRGLDIAEETCITVNNNGMMAIQHQVINREVGDGAPCFVDYIMCCLEPDSDDDDEEEDNQEHDEQEDSRAPQSHAMSQSQASYASTARDRSVVPSMTAASRSQATSTRHSSYSNRPRLNSDSDSDDAKSHMLSSSVAPLFGSVVAESNRSSSSPDTCSTHQSRKARRTAAMYQKKTKGRRKKSNDSDDGSVASRNLLESSSSGSDNQESSSEEEEESQPLDITAMASTPGKRNSLDDRSECSSPELVYGRR